MVKQIGQIDRTSLLRWFIFVSFLVDIIHSVFNRLNHDYIMIFNTFSISAIPRGLFVLLVLIILLIEQANNISKKNFLILFFVFIWLSVSMLLRMPNFIESTEILMYFIKLAGSLLVFCFIRNIANLQPIVKLLLWVFILQSIVVITGYFFNIGFLRTYAGGRLGIQGIMVGANQLSFVYITIIVLIIQLLKNNIKTFYLVVLFFVTISAMLLGTKATWGSLIIMCFYLIFMERTHFKIYYPFFIGLGISAILIFFNKPNIEHFGALYEKHGIVYTITSYRNLLVSSKFFVYLGDFEWYNYILGGLNVKRHFFEMDILDLFFFGGILGLLTYFYFLQKMFFPKVSRNLWLSFFFFLFLLNASFAGHVMATGLNILILPLTIIVIHRSHSYKTYESSNNPRLAH